MKSNLLKEDLSILNLNDDVMQRLEENNIMKVEDLFYHKFQDAEICRRRG